jgi:hypothetical protein
MFNYQLDKYPQDYNGYLIRTDFRIGIQIVQCLKDNTLEDIDKALICINLLYGKGCPQNVKIAVDGVLWFLSCGKEIQNNEDKEEIYDFDIDSQYIHSGFMKTYNINLSNIRMHWFEFVALMADLNGSVFQEIINYRSMDISDTSGKQREKLSKIKNKFKLPNRYTKEETEIIEKFLKNQGEKDE